MDDNTVNANTTGMPGATAGVTPPTVDTPMQAPAMSDASAMGGVPSVDPVNVGADTVPAMETPVTEPVTTMEGPMVDPVAEPVIGAVVEPVVPAGASIDTDNTGSVA